MAGHNAVAMTASRQGPPRLYLLDGVNNGAANRGKLLGAYNALEAALATQDSLERIIEFSTSEVFGQHAFNVNENQVTTIGSVGEARWTYAVSKLSGEHMAHAYHAELGITAVSVRPFNVYGPGQIGLRDKRFTYILFRNGKELFFDRDADPAELTNVLDRFPEDVARFRARLQPKK